MTCCRRRTAAIVLLLSAVPLAALIASLELRSSAPSSFQYRTRGWLRECAKWDPPRRRFLVSTFLDGGVAEVPVPSPEIGAALEERAVITDADVAGNVSLGIAVDEARGRLLVVYADSLGFRYGAAAAYDLLTWDRIFLTHLSGPDDEKSYADDVAIDDEGNAYITDARANKIWKLGLNGELLSVIRSQTFVQSKAWYNNLIGLNGIIYHPNGYLLVIHSSSGHLFKVDIAKEEATVVEVKGSLLMGDGMVLLSPKKVVIVRAMSSVMVESSDDWKTAAVTARHSGGPLHRIATSATVKDGKVYLSHIFGGGITKWTHVIAEAVFPMIGK